MQKKKPTKKKMMAQIPKVIEKELKENYIKALSQGFALANTMLLEYIDTNKTLDEVRQFVYKNTTIGRETILKVCGVEENSNKNLENIKEK